MEIIDCGEQARHGAGLENQAMESAVCRLPGAHVARTVGGGRRGLGSVENCRRQVRYGMAERQHLQCCAHLSHLAHLLQIEGCDAHAAARLADGQTLCFEPAESLTNRHVAGAEFLGDMILP